MTLTWLDKPFFDIIFQINTLFPYFMTLARYISGILLLLSLGMAAFKYAINHSGFKDDMVKTITACVLFYIIISAYPAIIMGLNTLVYKIAMNTLYTGEVQQMIDKTRDNTDFWKKKQDKNSGEYSDIIASVKEETNSNSENVADRYILDLYLEGTGYFSPNSVIRVLMLIMETIHYRANMMPRNGVGIPKDLGNWLLLEITALIVLFCGIFAALQYFIGAIEFSLISAIGIIMLPGMIFGGTKFLTEKFIGAILGQFLKLLFVSICLMLMCTGFLSLATKSFSGALDQAVFTIVAALIYMMLCQSGPQLAVSLLTGSPQMSLMEAVKGAATMAGAAIGGAHLAGSIGKPIARTTVINGGGGIAKAAGSFGSSFKKNFDGSKDKSFLQNTGSAAKAMGAGTLGAMKSLALSGAEAVQSGSHNLARSVLGGSKGGGSTFNKNADTNRFSAQDKYSTPHENGTRKTVPEFYKQMYEEGKSQGVGTFGKNKDTPGTSHPESSSKNSVNQNDIALKNASGSLAKNKNTPWAGYEKALPPVGLPSNQPSRYLAQSDMRFLE